MHLEARGTEGEGELPTVHDRFAVGGTIRIEEDHHTGALG
jgi:hypothetical protein